MLNSGLLSRDVCCFQAEGGIRDVAVTGVQTCALPILLHPGRQRFSPRHALHDVRRERLGLELGGGEVVTDGLDFGLRELRGALGFRGGLGRVLRPDCGRDGCGCPHSRANEESIEHTHLQEDGATQPPTGPKGRHWCCTDTANYEAPSYSL